MINLKFNWFSKCLLAITLAFVFIAGFTLLGLPTNKKTVYAATNYTELSTITLQNVLANKDTQQYGSWSWTNPLEYRESDIKTYTQSFYDTFKLTYTTGEANIAKTTISITMTDTSTTNPRVRSADEIGFSYFLDGVHQTQTSDTVCIPTNPVTTFAVDIRLMGATGYSLIKALEIKVYKIAASPVTISAGTGVKSVYLSTNQNATSGDASGTSYNNSTVVYGFAKLSKGYSAPTGWTLVSGTANTENAIYRVGSVNAGSSNFGTKNANLTTYNITYNLNGGSIAGTNPTSYNVNTDTFTLINPTRNGYSFKGWSGTGLSGEANTNVSVAKGSIGNRTYTANWTANTYTITYNTGNGGSVDPISTTYTTSTSQQTITLPTPSRTGYSFIGWVTVQSGVSISDQTELIIDANTYGDFSVTANWTANTYEVAFDGAVVPDGYKATYGYSLPEISIPTAPEGYTFAGYYDAQNENGSASVSGNKYIDNNGQGCKAWDKANNEATLYGYFTKDMIVDVAGYNGVYDEEQHTITVSVVDPDSDYQISYGIDGNAYNQTTAPTYINGGTYTVYFEITKAGYTTFYGQADVVITPQVVDASEVYASQPTAINKLVYTGEDITLISAGTVNSGYGDIVYRVVAADESVVDTEYSTSLPKGHNATTYTIYYKTNGNNYAPEEASFTVTISPVDKSALSNAVDNVDTYLATIRTNYPNIAETLDAIKEQMNKVISAPNVTSDYVAGKVNELNNALSAAQASVTAVDTVKANINAIGVVAYTTASEEAITAARTAYDDLSEDEKNDVTNYITLTTAESTYRVLEVEDKINAIDETTTYTDECKAKIDAARTAYEALSEDEKNDVTNYTILTTAESEYRVLDTHAKIEALNNTDLEGEAKEEAIDAAIEAYYALTSEEKTQILENETEDNIQIYKAVETLAGINLIDNEVTYTPESKEKIDEARRLYNSLTDEQEALVLSYDAEAENRLLAAESTYRVLDVEAKIDAIGDVEYTAESKAKIDAAKEAYEALSDEEKNNVDNYSTLTSADQTYTAVDEVVQKINAIGDLTYTEECGQNINTAMTAFENLTEEQQELIPTYAQTLNDANETYETIDEVVTLIAQIGEVEYNSETKQKLDAINEILDGLTEEQLALIPTESAQVLNEAESEYRVLDVEAKIEALNNTDLEDDEAKEEAIDAAIEAYYALTSEEKTQILENETEDNIQIYKAVETLAGINLIDNEVTYTPESKEKIDEARRLYNNLTDEQEALVLSYNAEAENILLAAESTYRVLDVKAKIEAIGTVEYNAKSKVKIEAAKAAYQALSEEEKKQISVDEVATLSNAEESYAKLDKEANSGLSGWAIFWIVALILFVITMILALVYYRNRKI